MPKTVASNLIPYFYKKAQTVLTGYEFILRDATYRYVANNQDISNYTALAIKRGTITTEDGTILNELDIGLDNVDLAFRQWVLGGNLERRECKINLLFTSGTSLLGTVLLFWGEMDSPKGDENWVTVTVRPFYMLDREYPRRIYQIGCNWRFSHQTTCEMHLDDYQYIGALSAESNGTLFTIAHGQAVNYFVPGYVEITNGDYIGEVRPVAFNGAGDVTVRVSFGHTVPSGTGIKLQKLCAKNPDACQNTFNNYANYGGFPTVPKQPII